MYGATVYYRCGSIFVRYYLLFDTTVAEAPSPTELTQTLQTAISKGYGGFSLYQIDEKSITFEGTYSCLGSTIVYLYYSLVEGLVSPKILAW